MKTKQGEADDAEDSDDEEELERVCVEDAWLFPVVRACPNRIRVVVNVRSSLPFNFLTGGVVYTVWALLGH